MSYIVGVTGRSGSGKSTFMELLQKRGYDVINCDALSREVQKKGSDCFFEIISAFGDDLLLENGELDRRALGEICFSNPKRLETLNDITHKYILDMLRQKISKSKSRICFFEAGALFESGADTMCDAVVAVVTSHENSLKRIVSRDGVGVDSAELRLGAQLTNDEIVARSDYVIQNDLGLSELEKQTQNLIIELNKKFNTEA